MSSEPVTVADIKELAKKKLDPAAYEYYRTGADQEYTLHRNSSIYQQLLIRARILRDVSNVDTSVTVFGKRYAFPIAIAPSGYQRLAHDDGEKAMYRAARATRTNMVLSTSSTTSIEDVVASAPPPVEDQPSLWFQLYVYNDKRIPRDLMQRAARSGAEAIVVTVDSPVVGNRLHERKSPLKLPSHMSRPHIPTASGVAKSRVILNAKTAAEAKAAREIVEDTVNDNSLTWQTMISWLRENTELKVVVKGVMTGEDAALAVQAGADGIVVSNHGARQLDGCPSTLEVLPEVVEAVAGRVPVMFDGGIEKGIDVFKALALGADLCLVGRSALWGLAHNGQQGVEDVLNILERELSRTMALAGASCINNIARDMLGVTKKETFGIAKL